MWTPPASVSREKLLQDSRNAEAVYSPDKVKVEEFLFRIESLGLPWDIGGAIYDPTGSPAWGPDGRRVGILLIHGGGEDHRSFDTLARLLAGCKGYRVVAVSYPGNLYLGNDTHDWPGDTIESDGSVRTPMWARDEIISPDQYDLVQDASDPAFHAKYGTLIFTRAREGTPFHHRLAAWPYAYEEAFRQTCARYLPEADYSIYASGHSTGGPLTHMLLQRVQNIVGFVGAESSPYGYIFAKMLGQGWPYDFDMMTVRTWRDVARYAGPEAGPEGSMRLPSLMEEVFARHASMTHLPLLKAQQLIQFCAVDALKNAAGAVAKRLRMTQRSTDELIERFAGYPFPLRSGARPVPPLIYCIMSGSRDHSAERYHGILLPELGKLEPAPKAHVVQFEDGTHYYQNAFGSHPFGTAPGVVELWSSAISGGYFLSNA
ncbi:MAG: hypothetical protein JWQ95_5641 [Sphaerisporangium sp.]|nr:hypothetical protein [Sphaerisporangium sp.]